MAGLLGLFAVVLELGLFAVVGLVVLEFGLAAVVLGWLVLGWLVLGLLVLGLIVITGLFWLVLVTVVLVLGLLPELSLLGFLVFAKTGAGFSRNV